EGAEDAVRADVSFLAQQLGVHGGGQPMEIVTAGGEPLEIEQTGKGPDLVLLHSLLSDPRSFAAVVPALSRSRRVTLVSLPGFGRSAPAGASIEDSADRVAQLFSSLEKKPDVLGNG